LGVSPSSPNVSLSCLTSRRCPEGRSGPLGLAGTVGALVLVRARVASSPAEDGGAVAIDFVRARPRPTRRPGDFFRGTWGRRCLFRFRLAGRSGGLTRVGWGWRLWADDGVSDRGRQAPRKLCFRVRVCIPADRGPGKAGPSWEPSRGGPRKRTQPARKQQSLHETKRTGNWKQNSPRTEGGKRAMRARGGVGRAKRAKRKARPRFGARGTFKRGLHTWI